MPFVTLPTHLDFSGYWKFPPGDKFNLFDSEFGDTGDCETARLLKKRFTDASIEARNMELWERCKLNGIRASDLKDYFGGNTDHIRRSLELGKASDQHLWFALHLARINPEESLVVPHLHHQLMGMSRTVEEYRQRCESLNTPLAHAARQPNIENAAAVARVPVKKLSLPHSALMSVICRDDDILNEWFILGTPVAFDFSLMSESPALGRFAKLIYGEAAKLLSPKDVESLSALKSWAPDVATPAIVLGEIATVWNSYQLYWHFAHDVTKF